MKPVRKLLIVNLAFLLILSSVNTTAFAIETDNNGSNPTVMAKPNTILENAAVKCVEAVQNQNLISQESREAESYANRIVTVSDSPALSNDIVSVKIAETVNTTTAVITPATTTTADQPVVITDQTADKISETAASAVSNPGVILNIGEQIAVFALKYNGFKYVYGAASPSVGFDCSGFAYYVYKQFGYTLPRTAHVQYLNGTAVVKSDLQPGDLVFFATYSGRAVTHVGIYVGNNTFIHAATTRKGVIITSLDNSYWSKAFVGAKRINSPEISLSLL